MSNALFIAPAFGPSTFLEVTFDVAYQTYASYVDGLAVWGRLGGAGDWAVRWSVDSLDLACEGCYTRL